MVRSFSFVLFTVALLAVPTAALSVGSPSSDTGSYTESGTAMVSAGCSSVSNGEVEQAVDTRLGYVYEEWMGCGGVAFSRSTDGGLTWSTPMSVPGSASSSKNSWDPALAVAPDGTVYAVFMRAKDSQYFPVVDASFDHGQTFAQVSSLVPPSAKNWGDRDFIAVGPDGTVYVTWDYGPQRTSLTYICTKGGSCAFATGDLNVVIQWSKDRGATWSPIVPINPNFPAGGGDSAPILVETSGRIDVLYQGYVVTNPQTYTLAPAHEFFTSSSDGGSTWSAPVMLGPASLTMSLAEWWIDGSLGIDSGGNLYAAWDTQGTTDVGWLSYSTDHGATWSSLVRVTPDKDSATHIVEVTGGASGIAYVGWLADNSTLGYAMYVQVFSLTHGLQKPAIRVSDFYGDPTVWPGDTFGTSTLGSGTLVLSWGSGVLVGGQPKSQVFARVIYFSPK